MIETLKIWFDEADDFGPVGNMIVFGDQNGRDDGGLVTTNTADAKTYTDMLADRWLLFASLGRVDLSDPPATACSLVAMNVYGAVTT